MKTLIPKTNCYFWKNSNCIFPKYFKQCMICTSFFPKGDYVTSDIPFIDLVIKMKHNLKTLSLSIMALVISCLALIISILKGNG